MKIVSLFASRWEVTRNGTISQSDDENNADLILFIYAFYGKLLTFQFEL